MAGISQGGTATKEKTRIQKIPEQTMTDGGMAKYSCTMQHQPNTSIWLRVGASMDQNT